MEYMWVAIDRETGFIRPDKWCAELKSSDGDSLLFVFFDAKDEKEARVNGANAVADKLRQWADDISRRGAE